MKGQILHYSVGPNSGAISGEDGQRYSFVGAEWASSGSPAPGMKVDFVPSGNTATQIYLDPAFSASPSSAVVPPSESGSPAYGIRCLQCNSNIVPKGAINWLLFIVFLLLSLYSRSDYLPDNAIPKAAFVPGLWGYEFCEPGYLKSSGYEAQAVTEPAESGPVRTMSAPA